MCWKRRSRTWTSGLRKSSNNLAPGAKCRAVSPGQAMLVCKREMMRSCLRACKDCCCCVSCFRLLRGQDSVSSKGMIMSAQKGTVDIPQPPSWVAMCGRCAARRGIPVAGADVGRAEAGALVARTCCRHVSVPAGHPEGQPARLSAQDGLCKCSVW